MSANFLSGSRCAAAVIIIVLFASVCFGQESVDQQNNPTWKGGAVNILPSNKVSQVFVPALPWLTGIEAALKTGNLGRGSDKLTMTILDEGRQLASASADVKEGFDGFCRFNLPGGGITVTPGRPLTIMLLDTGKNVFWWKYLDGNPYPAGGAFFNGAPFHDNDFIFRTYGRKVSPSFSLAVTPDPASLARGGTLKLSVAVTRQGGFTGPVNISFLSLPQGVTASPASQTVSGASGTITVSADVSAAAGQFKFTVRGTSGALSAQREIHVKIPATLAGYVDLHTHPMGHLAFGRKLVHGAPDIGAIIPKGTKDCNSTERRATSREDALGHCNSTHGGWGVDNTCGDYLRAAILNYGIEGHDIGKSGNIHGDHEHRGYPGFPFWPNQSSKLHQKMWWEWVYRAYQGGLRVIVALTVNNELLAEITNGDAPYDDKTVADIQIAETVRMVNNHRNFMEIAYSAADLRRIVGQNKLAVILGMEVDKLGNIGKPGVPADAAAVRAEIRRLHQKGIRYVFPIHLINNSFGGTAVYNMMFSFANKRANGAHFMIGHSADPDITYNAAFFKGYEKVGITALYNAIAGLGNLPAPCFNDIIKCSPPPGRVSCCGSFQTTLNAIQPTPDLNNFHLVPPGHVNIMGLTPLGETAINEMMKLGMMIDIDHMSERSMTRTVQIAEGVPGGYPVVMGHNKIRVAKKNNPKNEDGSERDAPAGLARRLAQLGGMMGVGAADQTAAEFVADYRRVLNTMGSNAFAGIGTDVNGMERLPKSARAAVPANSQTFYSSFFSASPIKTRQTTGSRTWDYVLNGGVPHYGLMPEFLHDVKISQGSGPDVYGSLMQSVERLAQMWQKCEAVSANVR